MRALVWRVAAVTTLIVLAFTACAQTAPSGDVTSPGAAPAGGPHSGGLLAYGVETDPNGLDATRNAWDPVGLLVANTLFDTWAEFDANGVPQPYLAESWDHNKDFTRWTLRLRPGITFSDGEKLDADAAVKMTNAVRASAVTGRAAANIAAVAKVDDLTIVATMAKPWASFPALLTGQGGYVMAPKQLDDPSGFLHPIGTGPFVLRTWDSENVISVARNPRYWRHDERGVQLPYLDGVDFHIIPDGQKRIADLRSGTIDATSVTNASDVQAMGALDGDRSFTIAHDDGPTDTTFIMLNTSQAPLDDVRVRRAIAYATDVDALAEQNHWPKDRLADSPFAKGSTWYADTGFPRYDLAKAKELVGEYEAEHGPIHLSLNGSFETALLQQLSDQWAQAGITATIAIADFKKSVILAVAGTYEADFFHYFGTADPDTLWHFWSSSTAMPNGQISLNFTRLGDPEIDQAIDEGRASPDPAVRKDAYRRVQQRFTDLVPYVWLYHMEWLLATRTGLHDVRNVTLPGGSPAADFDSGTHRLTETWIEPDNHTVGPG